MTQALSKMKDIIVLLFTRHDPLILLKKLITLFLNTIEPVRKGRSYRRKHQIQQVYSMPYKQIR